ncbi:MAG: hypothetical protein ACRDRZ_18170 [Pseudonocardiaceae bacterium]
MLLAEYDAFVQAKEAYKADQIAARRAKARAIDLLDNTRGGAGLSVVFGAGRELYPWRGEQAVHDVQDRLLALVARG